MSETDPKEDPALARLDALIDATNVAAAARALSMNGGTVERLRHRLGVQRGTLSALREAFARLDAQAKAAAS
jgi:hypothetical protein